MSFDAGAISLDFAQTELVNLADLGGWLGERFASVTDGAVDRDLADARFLRAAIAAIATAISTAAEPRADDIDTVNLYAATPNIPPVLSGGNRQAGRRGAPAGQALATIARDAVTVFSDQGHSRVRECAAEDCSHVFYDESRSNNRRWCSMESCGNRAKVRAHRERAAGTAGTIAGTIA
jgi:predicted RNA-binding Zn ribbon-like protein